MQNFIAIIDIYHEESIRSAYPASHHKIFGVRVIDYMLRALMQATAQKIFVLVEKAEYCHYLDDAIAPVICKGRGNTSVEDIVQDYGQDAICLVLSGAMMVDAMDIASALRYAMQTSTKVLNIEDAEGFDTGLIIENRVSLARATKLVQTRINNGHMYNGVTMINPDATYIAPDVKIGMDTIIYPNVTIEGDTTIGANCLIGQNCRILNMKIGDGVEIWDSTCVESEIGDGTSVGPYAYLRPNSVIGKKCKIGDFVEIKNATMGDGSKASHLGYIGDAIIGKNVNFGCGAITVNYDGKCKSQTVVEDNAFIGSNSNLVAPVRVCEGAYVAAGSTITKEVPCDALAVARSRQENKEGWVSKRRGK
ncbi:MAG: hypothetical protein FWE34_07430 [Defluviitaleaceae bacterium]|nr:hypothetical protein [Defluviitaleaceae bacterium]